MLLTLVMEQKRALQFSYCILYLRPLWKIDMSNEWPLEIKSIIIITIITFFLFFFIIIIIIIMIISLICYISVTIVRLQ